MNFKNKKELGKILNTFHNCHLQIPFDKNKKKLLIQLLITVVYGTR